MQALGEYGQAPWQLVRHAYDKWPKATDNLLGTAVYGDASGGPLSDNEFSIKFDDLVDAGTFFLFRCVCRIAVDFWIYDTFYPHSNDDCASWLVTTFDQFSTRFGSNVDRQILASSTSSTPYTAKWYNRGNAEDPWISYEDHANGIVYGENSNGWHTQYARGQHINVWIAADLTTPTGGTALSITFPRHDLNMFTQRRFSRSTRTLCTSVKGKRIAKRSAGK